MGGHPTGRSLGLDVRLYRMRGCYDPTVPTVGSGRREVNVRHWLMKSEPDEYSIDDLKRDGTTPWEGVRNYQARNFMRDTMVVGDRVLFYHSSCKVPGVAGIAEVTRASYPDATARDPTHPAHDPRATDQDPRWFMVDVGFVEAFEGGVPLAVLKAEPALEGMIVTRRGQRLSVQPVSPEHFAHVVGLGRSR